MNNKDLYFNHEWEDFLWEQISYGLWTGAIAFGLLNLWMAFVVNQMS